MGEAGDPFAQLRQVVSGLNDQGWVAAALSIAFESGLAEMLSEPRTAREVAEASGLPPALALRALEILVAMDLAARDGEVYRAPGLARVAASPYGAALRAELAGGLLQAADVARNARAGDFGVGWTHTDPEVLRAQGLMSAGSVDMLEKQLFPSLPGMSERLAADSAAFLDVGTGVAAVAIEMCRRFPALRAVGLEPQDAPLAIAHEEVARAGLADRIELRRQLIEDLDDEAAFDFAWLPATFMPTAVVEKALVVCLRALRPGGWMATGVLGNSGDQMVAVAARLRAVLWGAGAVDLDVFRAMIEHAGFGEVRVGPSSPAGFTPIVAQRPE